MQDGRGTGIDIRVRCDAWSGGSVCVSLQCRVQRVGLGFWGEFCFNFFSGARSAPRLALRGRRMLVLLIYCTLYILHEVSTQLIPHLGSIRRAETAVCELVR